MGSAMLLFDLGLVTFPLLSSICCLSKMVFRMFQLSHFGKFLPRNQGDLVRTLTLISCVTMDKPFQFCGPVLASFFSPVRCFLEF